MPSMNPKDKMNLDLVGRNVHLQQSLVGRWLDNAVDKEHSVCILEEDDHHVSAGMLQELVRNVAYDIPAFALSNHSNLIQNPTRAYLKDCGIVGSPECVVCVLLPRGIDWIVSYLSICAIGAVYVPLDSSLPSSRLRQIVSSCRPSLIITTAGADVKQFDAIMMPPIVDIAHAKSRKHDVVALTSRVPSQSLSYLVFTSRKYWIPKRRRHISFWCFGLR